MMKLVGKKISKSLRSKITFILTYAYTSMQTLYLQMYILTLSLTPTHPGP